MRKMKETVSKIFMLLFVCFMIGTTANAANTVSSEVWIEIKGTEATPLPDVNNKTRQAVAVETGDGHHIIPYLLVCGTAALFVGLLLRKKYKKGVMAVIALFLLLFCINTSVYAAEPGTNVDVTVPSRIDIVFSENGENSISDFEIENHMAVPIVFEKVHATECNEWLLCDTEENISVNTKKLSFEVEGQIIKKDENVLNITVAEEGNKSLDLKVGRGAWTHSNVAETALQLEFEYKLGRKQFDLSFDTNGSGETIPSQKVYNGDSVTLPSIKREGYELAGWEDPEGNLHTEHFVMPMKDITLKAKWKEIISYALYLKEDTSLRFVRSADPINVGSLHDGKAVTAVYTGFEEKTFQSEKDVPWYDGNYYSNTTVTKVIVEDEIKPKCTAYWFRWMYNCQSMDLTKLDTSRVTDMSYMFGWAGMGSSDFSIKGVENFDVSKVTSLEYTFAYVAKEAPNFSIDISNWNVSNVRNMRQTFSGIGYNASTISLGDLSKWDVSNVTDMYGMFQQTGYKASWYLDLRAWNVKNVLNYTNFNYDVYDKVVDPYWVH